jgi:hypothetical protein
VPCLLGSCAHASSARAHCRCPELAIDAAKEARDSHDVEIFAAGFGGALASTIEAMASLPTDTHAYYSADLDDLIANFGSIFCALLQSPRAPPPAGMPVPPSPPPSETICTNTCGALASDGSCDDGGDGSEYNLCAQLQTRTRTPLLSRAQPAEQEIGASHRVAASASS